MWPSVHVRTMRQDKRELMSAGLYSDCDDDWVQVVLISNLVIWSLNLILKVWLTVWLTL